MEKLIMKRNLLLRKFLKKGVETSIYLGRNWLRTTIIRIGLKLSFVEIFYIKFWINY